MPKNLDDATTAHDPTIEKEMVCSRGGPTPRLHAVRDSPSGAIPGFPFSLSHCWIPNCAAD